MVFNATFNNSGSILILLKSVPSFSPLSDNVGKEGRGHMRDLIFLIRLAEYLILLGNFHKLYRWVCHMLVFLLFLHNILMKDRDDAMFS
jgi:hypothetical protein